MPQPATREEAATAVTVARQVDEVRKRMQKGKPSVKMSMRMDLKAFAARISEAVRGPLPFDDDAGTGC